MLRTRQQKRAACENQSLTEVIDIDTYQFKASPVKRRVWITNGLYSLTQIEREILMSPVGWLSDPIIDVSQLLSEAAVYATRLSGSIRRHDTSIRYPTTRFHSDHAQWLWSLVDH